MQNIHLRPMAKTDLEYIWDYSVARWSTDTAERYLQSINKGLLAISYSPSIGAACPVTSPCRRYEAGSHLIFYQIFDTGIDVIRILHRSMDVSTHFAKENPAGN